MVNDKILCCIRNLVGYLHHDEEKHFEECDKEEPHILQDVKKVQEWLEAESDMSRMTCIKCKKEIICTVPGTLECCCRGWVAGQHEWPEQWNRGD